jgi:ribonuclease J
MEKNPGNNNKNSNKEAENQKHILAPKRPSRFPRVKPKNKKQPQLNVAAENQQTPNAPQIQPQIQHQKHGNGKLKFFSLGGIGEIGKNIFVLEYGDDIVVIDCGMAFPDEDMLGVDLVLADLTYLEKNKDRVRGVLVTHGHEDHIGGIPYLLRTINTPIYGTKLTLGILERKLTEHVLPRTPKLNVVSAGDKVRLGSFFEAEFIRVNHSIADACAIAVRTPLGTVIHSGDFKLDVSPLDGKMMDVARLGELGNQGVLLLLCESTNAERPGFTPSERKVGQSLEAVFMQNKDKRIVIATFSSNVHRVQQVINTSARYGRKVAVTGRSMLNIVSAAVSLGYMDFPQGVLVDINDIKKYPPEQLTLITTGSQGEPMSALYKMAFGDHNTVTLGPQDLVVISAHPIPGNEKLVGRVINALLEHGIRVHHDSAIDVHVSGHACQEELKLMHSLTRPKYFVPIHGEYRHLSSHREIALFMGMQPDNIFMPVIGRVLEIDKKGAKWNGNVPSGHLLVDGSGVGDVGSVVLRDRKHLSQDGLIAVVASVDMESGDIISGPDIVSRGFVYMKEAEEIIEEARKVAANAINSCLDSGMRDWMQIKTREKDDMSRFIFNKTKRKPMV